MRLLPMLVSLCLLSIKAQALELSVVGVFPGKAVLVVDGGSPKTYSAGEKINDEVKLLSSDGSSATFLINGRHETIALGQHVAKPSSGGVPNVILQADSRGHFVTLGRINGGSIQMMVDTGASVIALSAADATRLGVPYKRGRKGYMHTANGVVPIYIVKLDSVKVGDIELHHVEAAVKEGPMPLSLLGMSFLNRTDMRREGDRLILTKRY